MLTSLSFNSNACLFECFSSRWLVWPVHMGNFPARLPRSLSNRASKPSHMNTSNFYKGNSRWGEISETEPARSTGLYEEALKKNTIDCKCWDWRFIFITEYENKRDKSLKTYVKIFSFLKLQIKRKEWEGLHICVLYWKWKMDSWLSNSPDPIVSGRERASLDGSFVWLWLCESDAYYVWKKSVII